MEVPIITHKQFPLPFTSDKRNESKHGYQNRKLPRNFVAGALSRSVSNVQGIERDTRTRPHKSVLLTIMLRVQ